MKNYRVSRATLYNTMDLLMQWSWSADIVRGAQAQYEKKPCLPAARPHRSAPTAAVCWSSATRIQQIRDTVAEVTGFAVQHHALHLTVAVRSASPEKNVHDRPPDLRPAGVPAQASMCSTSPDA